MTQESVRPEGQTSFSTWQLIVLVMMAGMGGLFFYPENPGRSSLALLVLVNGLMLLSLGMLAHVYAASRAVSFPALLTEHLGLLPSRLVLAVSAVGFGAEIVCVCVRLTHMTGFFLLEKTPPPVILAVILLIVALLIPSGMRQVARTAELIFLAVLLPLVFLLGMGLYSTDVGEWRMLLQPDVFSFGQVLHALSPLGGIAATAYFAGYYRKDKLARSLLGGGGVLAAVCVGVLLCCTGVFSLAGLRHLRFPLTELSRIVSVGSVSLNHRFDILYIMIYTAVTVLTAGILLYCVCVSLWGTFRAGSHRLYMTGGLPLLYAASWISLSDDTVVMMLAMWGKALFLFGLVPLLYVLMWRKERRRRV